MRLPTDTKSLYDLTDEELKKAILERRAVIRKHRDQKGDDRCWLDDQLVWLMLSDTPELPPGPPTFEYAMEVCRNFHRYRNSDAADSIPHDAILDEAYWDYDIEDPTINSHYTLFMELSTIQYAIKWHRDNSRTPRTADDDRGLYSVLPEKIPADFRLPPEEEFLGEAKAPNAGCPAFWRSHVSCPNKCHNLHKWGPCP